MALLNETQQDYYDGNDFGGYQFVSLEHIITNFTIAYVGEGKIIPKIRRTDIAFHAQRAIQELSFDTFKSIKSQEITLPPSNTMVLPQDYVNYTKVCWVDGNGIERPLYPTKHTSNPTPILQNSDGDYALTAFGSFDFTNFTNLVVLDGEYLDILVGMSVSGAHVPSGTVVGNTTNASGITTIALVDNVGAAVIPTAGAGGNTLTFTNDAETLILEGSAYAIEGLVFAIGDTVLSYSGIDISNLSIGMLVSDVAFTPGTTIIDIDTQDENIIVSSDALSSIVAGDDITFISTPVDSTTWNSFSSDTSNSTGDANGYNHDTDIYDLNVGQRYGVDPAMAQGNGTYYIDNLKGLIHFSSNISGKTVILKYISDGLGTDGEMVVHKFAEEAMYKCIAYAIFSTSIYGQQLVPRFKKEKFAATRQAKLRLSNIKIEELTQLMRGKSKWIKH